MTVLLITALRAAETLVTFHRQHVESTCGADQRHHMDMVQRYARDVRTITREVLATGVTVENQVRRRDLDTAQKIIDRHPIMHGTGMAVDASGGTAAGGDVLNGFGCQRLATYAPVAALYLCKLYPGHVAHVFAFDRDHGIGQFFNDLPFLL
jgi:hypothetical protein